MSDKTNDLAMNYRRRGGLLRQLSDRQSDVRELISFVRNLEDKTVEDGLAGNLGHDDDSVVCVVLAVLEMGKDPSREVTVNDLIWAGAFLDHLDTMGRTVRAKPRKYHPPDGHNKGRGSFDD